MIYFITGITGYLGTALTRALLADPRTTRIVGMARHEPGIAAFRQQFHQDGRVEAWVGDVRDRDRLRWALRTVPDVVIHAAALKRVELCEAQPSEAVKTNIDGTRHVVEEAMLANVPKVLVVSSDKSTSAETCYGKTKAAAEEIALGQNAYRGDGPTRISVVRYGNVLGSTGSFLDQLLEARSTGGPVTITDPNATRFWWQIDDAVRFVRTVLDQMQGAEIWVPKLVSATVGDLARAIAPQAIQTVTGMRGSEKQHEAMISPTEVSFTYELPDCYVLLPKRGQWWSPEPPAGAVRVADTFRYTSNDDPLRVSFEVHEAPSCALP